MKLILLRHGEAGPAAIDEDRTLTAAGKADISRAARLISLTGWNVANIITSPLRRTVETGDLFAAGLQTRPSVRADGILAPGMTPEGALRLAGDAATSDAAVWVFHAPDVLRVASLFSGSPESSFYFTPGTMVALNLAQPGPAGRSMVIFSMPPEFLRPICYEST